MEKEPKDELVGQNSETGESIPETGGSTEQTPTKHKLFIRIAAANPDKNYEKDEDMLDAADELIDMLQGTVNKSNEVNQKLSEALEANPELSEILLDVIKGVPFPVAVARHYGPEDFALNESEPDYEAYQQASAERIKKQADKKAFEDQLLANADLSVAELEAFISEKEMTPEQAEGFKSKVETALEEIFQGKVSKTFLTNMYKAEIHEEEVSTAREQGEIVGRNSKIAAEFDKSSGDGMPALSSGDAIEELPKKQNYLQRGVLARNA